MTQLEKPHYSKTEAAALKLLKDLNTDTSEKTSSLKQRFHVDRTLDDDARCAICSSGEYEDNDNIVFCEFCGISVHQSCYGIEVVPEGDWFCVSCTVMGVVRARN